MRHTDYKVILMMESFIITPWAGAIVLWLGHIGALFQLCGIMETVMSKKVPIHKFHDPRDKDSSSWT